MRVQVFREKVRLTVSVTECRMLREVLFFGIKTRERGLDALPDETWKDSLQREIDLMRKMYDDILGV